MIRTESINSIINIIKNGTASYFKEFDKNIGVSGFIEEKEDEIIVHFVIEYDRDLEYLVFLKKQKTDADVIPNVKGYSKLNLSMNPYDELDFTDENKILAKIYDLIKNIPYKEIVCYQEFGIILRDPLDLDGIYNINVKYISD